MKRREVSDRHLARFPRIHICPGSGQILFATKQIASCIFCCTETVLLQKMLAPQGGRKPSEVGLLIESFRAMIEWRRAAETTDCTTKKSDV
jgi:hypothetical protein